MAFYKIPLKPMAQTFTITLALGVVYRLRLVYCDTQDGGWILDISSQVGTPIVCGIPLITGANLLEQYAYLGIGGRLWVASDGDPTAVPTYDSLGVYSYLYYEI